MFRIIRPLHRLLMPPVVGFLLLIVVAPSCRKTSSPPEQPPTSQSKPQAKEPAGPSPSSILAGRELHNPPALSGAGDEARRAVANFIDWAGASLAEEQEDGRRVLAAARENKEVVDAFTEEITKAQRTDHSRALLALGLLGEMRSPHSEEFLRQFVNQPLPQGERKVEGEIVEQTALATLQAKAIDGLAYLNTERANQEVLKQVREHGSIIVRSEAISAYLWNQKDKAAARSTLLQYVRKGEERYLDQITREAGERAGSFNPKLEAYLKAHPEVAPPAPQYGNEERQATQDPGANPGPPPRF